MITVKITQQQREYAWSLVQSTNLANRGEFDGDKRQQYAGKLAEVCFADLLGFERPKKDNKFDEGIDFVYGSKNIDIKTVIRKVPVKKHHGAWIKESQLKYKTDIYVFTSINILTNELTFIGCLDKYEVKYKGVLQTKDTEFNRDDGTIMKLQTNSYQILAGQLEEIKTPFDLWVWLDRRK